MLNYDYTLKLLDLQEVLIDKLEEFDFSINVFVTSNKNIPVCSCGCRCHIHDYRVQKIKAGKNRNKNVFIFLKKRRFVCPIHKKIYTETFPFVSKRHRIPSNICAQVIDRLRDCVSMTGVAKQFNISTSTVMRYFDLVSYPSIKESPEVMAIDEFKGNTGGFKYNTIITNPSTKEVLDIFKTRDSEYLKTCFSLVKQREKVMFFIQDMWEPFKRAVKSKFKNAKIVADKYHYTRQVTWAMENVRKREQQRLSKEDRLFFKRSKYILNKPREKLSYEEELYLKRMFSYSYELEQAYRLKETFRDFLRERDYQKSRRELEIWKGMAEESKLKEFSSAITAITNWKEEILNSKLIKETSGFTEGCNNKIKVLKRCGYGFRNFERFRNRILHIFNKKSPNLATSC